MPSSYSASCRFTLQATGEGTNSWGNILNTGAFALIDFAIAGFAVVALTGDYALTAANGAADQARTAMLKFTGTGAFTVTIPAVSKRYDVWNACAGALTITNGSSSVTLQPGEVVGVITDGGANTKRVQGTDFGGLRVTGLGAPTSGTDACTKAYADALAFSSAAGNLPGQGGSSGKFLTTDGETASWGFAVSAGGGLASVSGATLTVSNAAAAAVRAGTSKAAAMTVGDTYDAFAEVQLYTNGSNQIVTGSSAGSALDMSTFLDATLVLSANAILPNPTNPKVGQTGWIRLVQPSAGGPFTLAVGTSWKRPGGAPTLTTTANAGDILEYQVITPTLILYNVVLSPT